VVSSFDGLGGRYTLEKKLDGLWKYSRFSIPLHAEQSRRLEIQSKRLERPVLDDQEVEIISTVLFQSHRYQKEVRLTLYTEYDSRSVTGIVTCCQRDSFRLDNEDPSTGEADWEWIMFGDVIKAQLSQEWDRGLNV
jgi:hypothetical protein